MGLEDEKFRVIRTVMRTLERRLQEGENYNDVLERPLRMEDAGDFDAEFGRWSAEGGDQVRGGGGGDQVRERRQLARKKRTTE